MNASTFRYFLYKFSVWKLFPDLNEPFDMVNNNFVPLSAIVLNVFLIHASSLSFPKKLQYYIV